MVCRHFGHGNESGRDGLPPVSISVHLKELLQIGHRGSSGRNSIATGQITHSSTSTTKIGHAISGAGNPKAIATCQPLMRRTLHYKTSLLNRVASATNRSSALGLRNTWSTALGAWLTIAALR